MTTGLREFAREQRNIFLVLNRAKLLSVGVALYFSLPFYQTIILNQPLDPCDLTQGHLYVSSLITHPLSSNVLSKHAWVPLCSIIIYAHSLSFHYCLNTTLAPPLWVLFCNKHSQRPSLPPVFLRNLIFPLLLLERFYLNAELQLSPSRSSCRLSVRSRPFAFSSLDKEKKRSLHSSLTE